MSIHYRRSKLTEDQQKEVRRLVFRDGQKPNDVMKQFGISRTSFYRICGGAIGGPNSIERAYGS